ncbi:MAG: alpha/beta hydrolase [Myxococcales bacterium]|nr:alpha/beta hydrolase [Myxococcales bacterium]
MQHQQRRIHVGEVTLEVAVVGEGPLCVLVHGWPELWWSWRHQIEPLVHAGYRVAVPNVRGYGGSDAPRAVEAYRMTALAADIAGLVEALDEEQAILVGHDWGAPIVWSTALLHAERVRAVVGMSVPHVGRGGPMPPTELFASLHADRFFYISYFQALDVPEMEFETDVRSSLAKIYWMNSGDATSEVRKAMRARKTGYLDGIQAPDVLPDWLSEADLDRYAEAFTRSGFSGGIHRYRNMDRDWHELADFDTARIPQPALFLAGEHDSVLRYAPGVDLMQLMAPFFDDLRGQVVIPGAGHWVQQERPEAVNQALLAFLEGL